MEITIARWVEAVLTGHSPLVYLLVFLGGVVTSLGPCNLSMIPLLMAYISGKHDTAGWQGFQLSLFFTLGTAVTFMALGVAIALVGGLFGPARSLLNYLVAAVSITVGLHLLGLIHLHLPVWGQGLVQKPKQANALGAFSLGLVLGLAGSQCATPVLILILSLVMSKGQIVYGASLLLTYALGRGVPVVLAGTFTGLAKGLPALARWSRGIEKAAGFVLLVFGLYYIWQA
ncbi:MAG: cytochrome c biogenesis protein CcdA [Clostridia bacterium]|nr:MAG: cytochrome c biogenesis protein CcdA [Clostridia bacterium]